MKFAVYAFGKLKTPGLRDAADYYKKLCSSWLKLDEFELKPLVVSEKTASYRQQIQAKEGAILLDRIESLDNQHGIVVLLEERGKVRSTLQWAEDFQKWEQSGTKRISFCIGSSLGFSEEVRKQASSIYSLGPQTLSHELARVVLLEQIYRAYSVTQNHPYHNEGR